MQLLSPCEQSRVRSSHVFAGHLEGFYKYMYENNPRSLLSWIHVSQEDMYLRKTCSPENCMPWLEFQPRVKERVHVLRKLFSSHLFSVSE